MEKKPLTHHDLNLFTGDVERFRHWLCRRVIYTPGLHYSAERGQEIPDRLMTDSHDKQHGAAMARQTASQRLVKMITPRNHPANTIVVIKVLKSYQRKAPMRRVLSGGTIEK